MSTKRRIIEQLSILNNLQLFLREEHLPKKIYLDAYDATQVVIGFESLFRDPQREEFDKELFHLPEFLIYQVIMAKRLGIGLTLLPPHQGEFLHLLKKDFGLDSRRPLGNQEIFNKVVKISQELRQEGNKEEEESAYHNNTVQESEFNVRLSLSMYKFFWKIRMRHLFKEQKIFVVNNEEPDYVEVMRNPIYMKLLDAQNQVRPKHRDRSNNANDAMALTLFWQEVQRYKTRSNDEQLHIPILYDSSTGNSERTGFLEVIKKAGLEEEFSVEYDDEERKKRAYSTVRGTDYFELYAIFFGYHGRSATALVEQLAEIEEYKNDFRELEVKGDIESFLDFKDELEYYRDLQFLRNVAMDCYQDEDISMQGVLKALAVDLDSMADENFVKELDHDIKDIRKGLQESMKGLAETQRIWVEVKHAIDEFLRDSQNLVPGAKKAISLSYGLTKYALSEDIIKKIDAFFDRESILSEMETVVKAARQEFSGDAFQALLKDDAELLTYVLATFKVLDLNELIIDYSTDYQNEDSDISVALLRAGAILNTSTKYEQASEALDILEFIKGQLERLSDKRAELLIGMAYISYNYWLLENEPFSKLGKVKEKLSETKLNMQAINYAREAESLLRDDPDALEISELYARNIFIYYTVESAGNDTLREDRTQIMINEFMANHESYAQIWTGRLHDTIARYYYRMACDHIYDYESRLNFAELCQHYSTLAFRLDSKNNQISQMYGRAVSLVANLKKDKREKIKGDTLN